MGNFVTTQIGYEGEINSQHTIGQHTHEVRIYPDIEKQDDTTARITITCNFTHSANDKLLYNIKSKSLFTFFNIDLNNLEREQLLLTTFVIKGFSHLQGILGAKFQEQNYLGSVPNDPDISQPIQDLRMKFLSLFKKVR